MERKPTYRDLEQQVRELEQEVGQCRKLTSELFLEKQGSLENMLSVVDDHMSLLQEDLTIIWANRAAQVIFGSDLVGRKCYEAYCGRSTPCEPYPCIALKSFSDGRLHRHESKIVDGEGQVIYFASTANVAIWGDDGQPQAVIKISKDITSQKMACDQLQSNMEKMRKNLAGTIQAMARTVETRDAYTAGHQRRTAVLARAIAQEMGLEPDRIDGIRMAGVIHDLGKISVPAEILSKPGRISDIEFGLIKNHPTAGFEILRDIDFQWPVAEIVLQHHERMDGSGYPNGLKGDDILLEARILGVADVVEAMASHRPYRASLGLDKAINEITAKSGTAYDPEVVNASLRLFEKGFFFD